jgi:hypothetical protein
MFLVEDIMKEKAKLNYGYNYVYQDEWDSKDEDNNGTVSNYQNG